MADDQVTPPQGFSLVQPEEPAVKPPPGFVLQSDQQVKPPPGFSLVGAEKPEEPGMMSRIAGAAGRVGEAAWQGLTEGAGEKSTVLTPEAQAKLDAIQQQGGWKGALAGAGSTLATDVGTAGEALAGLGTAPFNAYQRGAEQFGKEIGQPLLGRDVAAMPEAFMGMPEALHTPHPPGTPEAIQADIQQAKETAAQTRAARPTPAQPEAPQPAATPAPTPRAITPEQFAREEEGVAPPPPVNAPAAQGNATPAPVNPASNFINLKPGDLKVDANRFQYKSSDEKGVTGALQGVTRWEPALANPITAWQSADGDMFVVNGHQRHDLATRAEAAGQPDVQIPTRVFKESDGYTPDFMKALGAYQNIAEGSGTALDAAKVLRGKDAIPTEMVLPQLPPKSEMVRQAQSLAKLSPNAFGMVENGLVPPAYAANVGDFFADPKQQESALSILAKADPANANQARMIVQDVRDSGFLQGVQGGLFGDEEFAKSLIPERAKILDGAMSSLRRTRGLYKAAVEGEQELTAAGNQLNPEANLKAKTGNEQLIDLIERGATLKGPISDALSDAARNLAAGQPRATVQAGFLSAVRKIVGTGEGAGVELGGVHGGEGYEEGPRLEAGRRPPVPPATGADLFGGEGGRAQRAPTREPTIGNDQRQQVMPGMEPSALQAQAARNAAGPRSGQLPADQGLFARSEPTQPQLPEGFKLASKWADRGGENFTDLLHTIPDLNAGHEGAYSWVLQKGKETGHEHIAVVDNATGQIVHAGTQGLPKSVDFDPRGVDATDAYTVHHNHPSGGALSGPDNGMLVSQALSHVVAHGHNGETYHAAIGPAAADLRTNATEGFMNRFDALRIAHTDSFYEGNQLLESLEEQGKITKEQAVAARNEVANRLMDKWGLTRYASTVKLPDAIEAAIEKAPGYDDDRRRADVIQPETRNSGLPQPVPEGGGAAGTRPGAMAGVVGGNGTDLGVSRQGPGQGGRAAESGNPGIQEPSPEQIEQPRPGLSAPPTQPDLNVPPTPQFDVLKDKQGIRRAAAEIKAFFSPTSMKGAGRQEQMLRQHGAELAQSTAQSAEALSKFRDAIDKAPVADQEEFTYRMETGQKQANPAYQPIADELRRQLDTWRSKIQGMGKGLLTNAINDYMGHVWGNYREWAAGQPTTRTQIDMQRQALAAGQGKTPLLGSQAFLKQRTFPTQREGINAGLIPATYNPVDLQLIKLREMQKYYHGAQLADQMKQSGMAVWVPAGNERGAVAAGYDRLEDRVFQPRLVNEANPAGFGRLEPGNWYAPEPAARLFNRYMGEGWAGQSAVYDAVRGANNALNSLQLGLSGFHATFVTLDTMKSQVALGIQQIARGDFSKGALSVTKGLTPYSLYDTIKSGSNLRSAWLDPQGAGPKYQKLAEMLNRGGGRINMDQFYRSSAAGPFFRNFGDLFDPKRVAAQLGQQFRDEPTMVRKAVMAPLKIAGRVLDSIQEPLMGYLVPRAKLGVFSHMAQDWMDAHPGATPEQTDAAMTKAWDSVDNRLGQLVYDNMFWSKATKDMAFLTTRSVGWNVGTVRELGGGFVDTGKFISDLAQGRNPEVTSRMAYTIAMPLVTAIYGSILNYLYTGQPPQSLLDTMMPRNGKLTPAGDPDRITIPGYEKDIYAYFHEPIGTVLNKMSPLLETAHELYENQDYYGGIIQDPQRDPKWGAGYADYLINQAMPFSWRGAKRERDEGADGLTQALSFWGFQPASKAITQPEVGAAYQQRQNAAGFKRREREDKIHVFLPSQPGAPQ